MAYDIRIMDFALDELAEIRAFDKRRIVEAIESRLAVQPTVETRNRKPLSVSTAEFEHSLPIWELRVGDYRVFYDVDEADQIVYVRSVRRKEQGQTTEDILT